MKRWNEQEVVSRDLGLDQKIQYDGSNNPIYVGRADPGSLTSEAKWVIYKMAYDANNNMTSLRFGGGSDAFDKIWDNRASLSYTDI